jgi:hypothetical protein
MSRSAEELMAARQKNIPRGALNIHPVFVKDAKGAILRIHHSYFIPLSSFVLLLSP